MKHIIYSNETHHELEPICYRKASKEELLKWIDECIDRMHKMVFDGFGFNASRKKSGFEKAYRIYQEKYFFNWQQNRKYMEAKAYAYSKRTKGVYYKLVNQNSDETSKVNPETK